jgi:DnaK suppressor protein
MNQEKLTFFKSILIHDLKVLQQAAGKTALEMKQDETLFSDPLDRAAAEHERNVELLIRNRDIMLIGEIREAISRIDHGVFGICEGCGEPIREKRLKVTPTSRLCIQCKSREEKGQNYRHHTFAFA